MSRDVFVSAATRRLACGNLDVPCTLGEAGVIAAAAKREGDRATPLGRFPLRRLLYRADRLTRPATSLPAWPIAADDAWCDAPGDTAYNRAVRLPYGASAETLWRDDGAYDLIVVLGHNDNPVVAGLGSAVFLHVARPGDGPHGLASTAGCVAVARDHLLAVLQRVVLGSALIIAAD